MPKVNSKNKTTPTPETSTQPPAADSPEPQEHPSPWEDPRTYGSLTTDDLGRQIILTDGAATVVARLVRVNHYIQSAPNEPGWVQSDAPIPTGTPCTGVVLDVLGHYLPFEIESEREVKLS